MKRLFAILMLVAGAASAQNATYGEHGMAMFGGREALYASHLPMFHAPHDYQVVLQFHLADKKQDAALRERLQGKAALWTIAPEKFELDRLAPGAPLPLQSFKADLVSGHFERGGKTEYSAATVVVDKVLVFRRLDAKPHASTTSRYLPVGRFLVKEIDSRPDFDHIVAIATTLKAPLVVPKKALAEPALGHGARTIYFETGDLQ